MTPNLCQPLHHSWHKPVLGLFLARMFRALRFRQANSTIRQERAGTDRGRGREGTVASTWPSHKVSENELYRDSSVATVAFPFRGGSNWQQGVVITSEVFQAIVGMFLKKGRALTTREVKKLLVSAEITEKTLLSEGR